MTTYRVILEGGVLPEFEPDVVRRRLAGLIGRNEEVAAKLLSGRPSNVKAAVDRQTGLRYLAALKEIGVACHLEEEILDLDIPAEVSAPAPGLTSGVVHKRATSVLAAAPAANTSTSPVQGSKGDDQHGGMTRGLVASLVVFLLIISFVTASNFTHFYLGAVGNLRDVLLPLIALSVALAIACFGIIWLSKLLFRGVPSRKYRPTKRFAGTVAGLLVLAVVGGIVLSYPAAKEKAEIAKAEVKRKQEAAAEQARRREEVAKAVVERQEAERQRVASMTPEQRDTEARAKEERALASIIQDGEAMLKRWREREAWGKARLANQNPKEPDSKPVLKQEWADIQARLSSIKASQPYYQKARSILAAMADEEKKAAAPMAAYQSAARAEARKAFAKRLEEAFLDKRMDTDVTVSGPKNTILRIKWVLTNKVVANDLRNSGIIQQAEDAGFKKVVLTDGYNSAWTWDLNPKPD